MQYRWLVDLQEKSAIAWRAQMHNYLAAIAKEVEYSYAKEAERVLNLPASIFAPEYLHKAAFYFKKRPAKGFRRLFVVSYLGSPSGGLQVYDAATQTLTRPESSEEIRAIYVAIAPWTLAAKKGAVVDTENLSVDYRDPQYRLLLNPITDEKERMVGLAGAVVDQGYFEAELLPRAIAQALPFLAEAPSLALVVEDSAGRVVWPRAGEKSPAVKCVEISRSLSFVFADWRLGLRGKFSRPENLAKTSFVFNLSLSVALGLVLLGGALSLLRTTSKEIKLSEMKNDFVSNVSHELRTPLSSIRVFGEFLRLGRASSEEKVREYGEYIETESRRLTQLINNILDFSRIESGHRSYQMEPCDLEALVDEALKTFEVRLRHRGIQVDLQRPSEPLPVLDLDAGAMGQAVCNLLDNAIKYSNGGHRIGIGLSRRKDWVVLSVEDQGIGISRGEQTRIFDRFHRVGTGLVHDVKGTGLGLSIVQHVVRAHGGHVQVESSPGKGSTFSIHLPAAGWGEDKAVDRQGQGGSAVASGGDIESSREEIS